jgi:cysteinyl-tRNA synthetase
VKFAKRHPNVPVTLLALVIIAAMGFGLKSGNNVPHTSNAANKPVSTGVKPAPAAANHTVAPSSGATPIPSAGDTPLNSLIYQLQNYKNSNLDEITSKPHQMAVIDLARDARADYFSVSEIGKVKASGKKVLAYFEIGSIEDFRADFQSYNKNHSNVFLNEWPGWPGEFFVKYWDSSWWDNIIRPRIDQALKAGYDGVYLDSPLAYEAIDLNLVPGETRETLGRRMADLIMRISKYAKQANPGFWVFPQNNPELQKFAGYTQAIDGIGMEELFFKADDTSSDQPCNEDFCKENLNGAKSLKRAGKMVIAIDYAVKPENIAKACDSYKREGFIGYVTTRALDVITPPCP